MRGIWLSCEWHCLLCRANERGQQTPTITTPDWLPDKPLPSQQVQLCWGRLTLDRASQLVNQSISCCVCDVMSLSWHTITYARTTPATDKTPADIVCLGRGKLTRCRRGEPNTCWLGASNAIQRLYTHSLVHLPYLCLQTDRRDIGSRID